MNPVKMLADNGHFNGANGEFKQQAIPAPKRGGITAKDLAQRY